MIIGNGNIASVLPERDDLLFFASGVSNSSEDRESEFKRERDLLLEQDMTKHLVYFSTLSVFYADTPYVEHKQTMELMVKDYFDRHTIVRLGNITWGKNPNTLLNFLRDKIANGKPYKTRQVWRYITDKNEFKHWLALMPDWNCEMNITGLRLTVSQIVELIKQGKL